MPYAQNVLGWAAAYATGVVPVDLPPITGPPPPLGDAHDEHPKGLGPGLPMNIDRPADRRPDGADAADRLRPVTAQPVAPPMFPWMARASRHRCLGHAGRTLICIGSQTPPAWTAAAPPWPLPQPRRHLPGTATTRCRRLPWRRRPHHRRSRHRRPGRCRSTSRPAASPPLAAAPGPVAGAPTPRHRLSSRAPSPAPAPPRLTPAGWPESRAAYTRR